MKFPGQTCREVECVVIASGAAVAELKRPEPVIAYGRPALVLNLAEERARRLVESADACVAVEVEVANQ